MWLAFRNQEKSRAKAAFGICMLSGPGLPQVNLEVQISWQAQRFVNLKVQISWRAQRFVNFEVRISWQ